MSSPPGSREPKAKDQVPVDVSSPSPRVRRPEASGMSNKAMGERGVSRSVSGASIGVGQTRSREPANVTGSRPQLPASSKHQATSLRGPSLTFENGRPSLGSVAITERLPRGAKRDPRAASIGSLRATLPGNSAVSDPPSGPATIRGSELTGTTASATHELRVKGINFTTALLAVHRLYGAAARDRVERDTPGELGDALRFRGIVIGGWYPIAWYRDFWKSLNVNLGIDEAGALRIGHRSAGLSVNVAYRALARMSSPATLLAMSARAFGYYFESGSLLVKQPEPKRLTAEWRDCHGFDNFIWKEVEGAAVYFVEATGATNVTFTVLAGGGSTSGMLATATWR